MEVFHLQINGGVETVITVKTTEYALAALTALATIPFVAHESGEDVVKIWVPDLLPEYGPYFYAWDGHQVGTPTPDREW